MVNYQNGKIYKIVDNTTGNIYIGSTAEKYLSRRLQRHLANYKRYIDKKEKYLSSFEILKNNNFEILLLETFLCNNKYELEQKERYYIENNTCVNKNIPTRTIKEWWEVNKDKVNKIKKEYYENNKEKILEKIPCDLCGSIVRKRSLNRHKKTEKCKRLSVCMILD